MFFEEALVKAYDPVPIHSGVVRNGDRSPGSRSITTGALDPRPRGFYESASFQGLVDWQRYAYANPELRLDENGKPFTHISQLESCGNPRVQQFGHAVKSFMEDRLKITFRRDPKKYRETVREILHGYKP